MINEAHLLALTYTKAKAENDTFVMNAIIEEVGAEKLSEELAEIIYILAGTAGYIGAGPENEKYAVPPEEVIESLRKIATNKKK